MKNCAPAVLRFYVLRKFAIVVAVVIAAAVFYCRERIYGKQNKSKTSSVQMVASVHSSCIQYLMCIYVYVRVCCRQFDCGCCSCCRCRTDFLSVRRIDFLWRFQLPIDSFIYFKFSTVNSTVQLSFRLFPIEIYQTRNRKRKSEQTLNTSLHKT